MKAILRSGFLALAIMALAVPANAGSFEDAVAAYLDGDYRQALKLYRKAAEWGHATAQNALGVMYERGEGVPQDYAEAVKFYRKAAEQGHVIGQDNLGRMYQYGFGVPQDYVQAHMWFNLAGAQAKIFGRSRDELAKRMTPDELAEAQRMAREWMAKHQR